MRPHPAPAKWNPDCHLCWGTGFTYPSPWYSDVCPNGCALAPFKVGGTYAGDSHLQVLCTDFEHVAWVDRYIEPLILDLWAAGVLTWVSCQGDPVEEGEKHRQRPYVGLCGDSDKHADAVAIIGAVGTITEDNDDWIRFEWNEPPPAQKYRWRCACPECVQGRITRVPLSA